MMEYNVDVGLWAHKHSYERLWPVYNYTVYKPDTGSSAPVDPYTDPKAPLHVITGTAVSIKAFVVACFKNHGSEAVVVA